MKLLLLMMLLSFTAAGQKASHKRLIEQIAALQVYFGTSGAGNAISNLGLGSVRESKYRDRKQHREFFESLERVNGLIKSSGKVGEIIQLQVRIMTEVRAYMAGAREVDQLTSDELDYCSMVTANVYAACLDFVKKLVQVTSDKELKMTDDERLRRIDAIYIDMQDIYAFTVSWSTEMGLLVAQRMREYQEIKLSRKLYR